MDRDPPQQGGTQHVRRFWRDSTRFAFLGPTVPLDPVNAFLDRLRRDPGLQSRVQSAVTADDVARLAQELGYAVSGSDLLLMARRSSPGVRVTRIDHPGEYPGRYI